MIQLRITSGRLSPCLLQFVLGIVRKAKAQGVMFNAICVSIVFITSGFDSSELDTFVDAFCENASYASDV